MTLPGSNVLQFPDPKNSQDASSDPRDRNPREFPFGMMLSDPRMLNGIDGFHWFKNGNDALAFFWLTAWPSVAADLGTDACHSEMKQKFGAMKTLDDAWVDAMNRCQDVLWIVWFGDFETLRAGDGPFERELRSDFFSSSFSDDDLTCNSQAFARFLGSFRSDRPWAKDR